MAHAPPGWDRVKQIVAEVLDAEEAEREALLRRLSGGDEGLMVEARSLVRASARSRAVLSEKTDVWLGLGGAVQSPAAGAMIGRYRLEGVVSEGASAVVYRAVQQNPERAVALKVMRSSLPMVDGGDRFRLEAAALARIEHPSVARIYEAGVHRAESGVAMPFIAMELVEGVAVTRFVRERGLTRDATVRLAVKIGGAVQAAHQRAVIHRDLKPSNILVTATGEPKVLDFGIARIGEGAARSWHTTAGSLLGTPGYMSPEQALGKPEDVDVRTDVWGLGVVLYEMLAGRLPFDVEGKTPLQVLREVASGVARPLGEVVASARGDLERVVMTALAREKEQRYASLQAFIDDLERVLADQPISVRRLTSGERAWRFVRKHRLGLGVAAVVAVSGLVAAASLAVGFAKAAEERDRAKAVNALLLGMIGEADPNFGNRNVTLLEAIAGVEARLATEMRDQPATEADVRTALGSMLFGVAEYARSEASYARAAELRGRVGDRPGAILDRVMAANSVRWLNEADRAMQMASAAYAEAKDELGDEHAVAIVARRVRAECMHDVQRLEESAAELREVMRVAEGVLGARSQVTLDATSNLAGVMTDMGAYAEAEVLLRRVLAAQGWLGEGGGPGSGTLDSLTLRGNLAMVMAEQGKPDEAIAMMRELVEDMRAALGPTHHSTLTTRSNLAENLRRAGRTEESLAMMKSLLDDSVAGLGWSHPTTLDQANGLAAFYVRQRRFEEAFAIASEALGHIERLLGKEHEFWHRMKLMVASANSGLGRHAEAIAAYAEEVAYYEGAFGREHRRTLEATNNFGTTLIEAGEGARAVEVLESVLSRVGEGRFESMESVVRRNYGRALVIAGRLEDAERELVRAYENSTARGEADNAGVCARHLAKLFEARGDAAAAAVWNDRVPR